MTGAGIHLEDSEQSLDAAGVTEGDRLKALVLGKEGTEEAAALWCHGGDRVLTWGDHGRS